LIEKNEKFHSSKAAKVVKRGRRIYSCRARTKSNSKTSRSESNLFVYKKLYNDSKQKEKRVKECKEKHKFDDFRSQANSLEKRNKFFIPHINKTSKKMMSNRYQSHSSEKRNQTEILYEDAITRKKAREALKINKNLICNSTPQVLPQSRKILHNNFVSKFDLICNQQEIECEADSHIQYDQYLVLIKAVIF
jgi:hypothetical protein